MKTVNIHRAKTELSRLLADVERGEEVTIARAGKPVARLVPVAKRGSRAFGADRGRVWIAPDFDRLPDDVLADFDA